MGWNCWSMDKTNSKIIGGNSMTKRDLLRGEKVKLTALKKDDISIITQWRENPQFLRLFDGRPAYPQTISNIEKWFEDITNSNTLSMSRSFHVWSSKV